MDTRRLLGIVTVVTLLSTLSGYAQVCPWKDRGQVPSPEASAGSGTGVHDVGLLSLTIDDVGGADGWRHTHIWPDTLPVDHLYWNWLAIGYDPVRVSDGWDRNWTTTSGGMIVIREPGTISDEDGYAQYEDSMNSLRVTQESYAWRGVLDNDYVIIKYTIKNIGAAPLNNIYAGHRSDFDVLGNHSGSLSDMSDCDTARNMGYMWDTSSQWHAGVRLLQGVYRGYHQGWYATNDSVKYGVLYRAGADPPTPYASDWCFWLSTGPHAISPGDSTIIGFAFLAGENLIDLQANADAAQRRWNSIAVDEERAEVRSKQREARLRIAPNPFRSRVTITFSSADQRTSASAGGASGHQQPGLNIYDASGRPVKSFDVASHVPHPSSFVSWNGCDDRGTKLPAGVYLVRYVTGSHQETQKVVLLR